MQASVPCSLAEMQRKPVLVSGRDLQAVHTAAFPTRAVDQHRPPSYPQHQPRSHEAPVHHSQGRSNSNSAWPQQQRAPPPPPGRELTKLIKNTATWSELQQLHSQVGGRMNHIHISAMLAHLAQLASRPTVEQNDPGPDMVLSQGQATGLEQPKFSQPNVNSRTLQLRPGPSRLAQELLQDMSVNMASFESRQIANCMWAVVKLGVQPSQVWVSRCLGACRRHLPTCEPQHLANITYALALAPDWLDSSGTSLSRRARNQWLETLFGHIHKQLHIMKPQELANIMWAAARMHTYQPLPPHGATARCLEAAGQLAAQRAGTFKSQELCNILWALGKLSGFPGLPAFHTPLIDSAAPTSAASSEGTHSSALSSRSTTLGAELGTSRSAVIARPPSSQLLPLLQQAWALVPKLHPMGLASLLLSIGWLGARPEPAWMHQLLSDTQHLLDRCYPVELSNIVMGLAYMGIQPQSAWVERWERRTLSLLPTFSIQHIANSVWALARVCCRLERVSLARLLLASAALLPEANREELCMLLPSLVRMRVRPGQAWLELYAAAVFDQLPTFPSEELCNVLAALARVGFRPRAVWFDAVLEHLSAVLPGASIQCHAMVLHSLTHLGYLPSKEWWAGFQAVSQTQLARANVRDLSSLVWSSAMLELNPGDAWMTAAMLRMGQLLRDQHKGQQYLAATRADLLVQKRKARLVQEQLTQNLTSGREQVSGISDPIDSSEAHLSVSSNRGSSAGINSRPGMRGSTGTVSSTSVSSTGMTTWQAAGLTPNRNPGGGDDSTQGQRHSHAHHEPLPGPTAGQRSDHRQDTPGSREGGMHSQDSFGRREGASHNRDNLNPNPTSNNRFAQSSSSPAVPQSFGQQASSSQGLSPVRGGQWGRRHRQAAATQIWTQDSLSRVAWALTRLGYTSDHSYMKRCRQARAVLQLPTGAFVTHEMLWLYAAMQASPSQALPANATRPATPPHVVHAASPVLSPTPQSVLSTSHEATHRPPLPTSPVTPRQVQNANGVTAEILDTGDQTWDQRKGKSKPGTLVLGAGVDWQAHASLEGGPHCGADLSDQVENLVLEGILAWASGRLMDGKAGGSGLDGEQELESLAI